MVATSIRLSEGELRIGEGNERYILIPMRAYAEIVASFFDLVGVAAGGPLYYLGKRIGHGLVEELENRLREGVTRRELTDVIMVVAKLFEELGFGTIEVNAVDKTRIILKMKNPPSLAGTRYVQGIFDKLKSSNMHVCYLEAGMIAGSLEKILGKRFRAREVESKIDGDSMYCFIEVTEV
ncbi:hypothetical protein Pyrde_0319 [Pyrodictium delaneyi]|uniref:4-vinyl reductase 4VR domain-containing protein n=1 Tax=Pyrodictium delaneyi TaxID=1273541 RepID=A0A0N7JCU5_9CREN|nr:hypothetical protein [Pyrodictium delaneyi]ALL00369.1 hypothetical protein Pyrde_0319 [Pyrodictium delaneyi]OWJ54423.1 hypothetical protein Pdsh_08120 [Pyrodictium delaneyi]